MNSQATLRWLIWKENRLVLPLFYSLIAIVILIAVATALMPVQKLGWGPSNHQGAYLLLLFPTFLATGLGLVLVGQEREQGTITWLQTLPLPPQQLIGLKLLVAFGWLIGAWGIALLIGNVTAISFTSISPSVSVNDAHLIPLSFPFWIVQSVVVLLAGFYASWKLRAAVSTIALMAAIVLVPLAANFGFHMLNNARDSRWLSNSQVFYSIFATYLLMIPILAWLTRRAALRSLLPRRAPTIAELTGPNPFDPAMALVDLAIDSPRTRVFDSAWIALIWQTLVSSKWQLALSSLLMTVGVIMPILENYVGHYSVLQPVLLFASPMFIVVGATWGGVLVFQGDGSHNFIRFLAERGYNPRHIWLARHVAILSILASFVLIYLAISSLWLSQRIDLLKTDLLLISPLTLILIGGISFAAGAWTSQLLREPVMAYLISPIVASMLLGWLLYCVTQAMAPLLLASLVGLSFPSLATLFMARRFANGTDRPLSFLLGLATTVLIFLLPLVPAIRYVQSIPKLDHTTRTAMIRELRDIDVRQDHVELRLVPTTSEPTISSQGIDQEWVAQQLNEISTRSHSPTAWIEGLSQVREEPNRPAKPQSNQSLHRFYDALELARLRFLASTEDDDAANMQFEQWIDAAATMAAAMRQSTLWRVQDSADVLEIWLADVLGDSDITERIDEEAVQSTLKKLPTITQRNAMRRNAVLASWWRSESRDTRYYSFPYDSGLEFTPPALTPWTQRRRADSIVAASLLLLQTPKTDKTTPNDARRKLHQLLSHPAVTFEDGVYGKHGRTSATVEIIGSFNHHIARYWGMAWEQRIESLKEDHHAN
ncbi:hypothetical protein Pla22_07760 [Rubripirellula amarantea]|uniref:ABC-2 family transporter protein n=1 Tax=Rubripirellula amarantea TaxID=2527999 RepID=A0A5C5WRE7_9BACT|nr:ABC transporter permease [Rubripirellula amarantea]TWT53148.1 hypothetical protein Pla22_07760 [Rubripirellula amarantea]